MTWGQPIFLWALLLLPVAIWAFASRRSGEKREPLRLLRVSVGGARVQPQTGEPAQRQPWSLLTSLAFALLALAQPHWGTRERSGEEPAREILIALDLSRSMLVDDVAPSRLQRAQAVVRALLDGLHGERVGLIVFAGVAYVQVPLSSDYQIATEFLPVLEPGYLPQGGSDYAGMLRAAREGFSEDATTDRYLFVLSDGESTTDGWRAELSRLRQRGVTVVALGVGTAEGGDVPAATDGDKSPAHSRLEPSTLQAISAETGIYRNASETLDVSGLLAESVELGRQTRQAKRQTGEEQAEQFEWFLVTAFAFGLLGLWREIGVRARTRSIVRGTLRNGLATPVAASLLVVGVIVVLLGSRKVWAHDDGHVFGAEVTATDKLHWLVEDLAQHRAIDARDLALMAERTISYAVETLARGQPASDGAIRDALAAVNFGEKMKPKQADWTALRSELKRLLARPAEGSGARPPEQKKEARDEEDRPSQTNGQGSQQTTSESMGQGGVAKTDAVLGELRKESPRRLTGPRPAAGSVRPGTGAGDAGANGATRDPLHALTLKRYREVIKADTPGVLFQALAGDARTEAAGGHDW